jgi:SRSO17 transposase
VCDKSKTVANLCDTMAECRKGKKARSSYNWFFSDANWDENEVAQRKVELFIDKLCLKENDRMWLIIDDTYNEKELKRKVWANFTIIVKKPTFGVTILLPLLSNQRDCRPTRILKTQNRPAIL